MGQAAAPGDNHTIKQPVPFYDPEQLRDTNGKWTKGGAHGQSRLPEWREAHATAMSLSSAWLEGSSTSEQARSVHRQAFHEVFTSMPLGALRHFLAHAGHAIFYEDTQQVTSAYRQEGQYVRPGQVVGAFLVDDPRLSKVTLHLDGGSEQGQYHDTVREVYAHEFSHAIDKGARLSGQSAWLEAWKSEVDVNGEPLSKYARKNRREGFAEFGRLLFRDPAQAREKFPKCYDFWKTRGLTGTTGESAPPEPAREEASPVRPSEAELATATFSKWGDRPASLNEATIGKVTAGGKDYFYKSVRESLLVNEEASSAVARALGVKAPAVWVEHVPAAPRAATAPAGMLAEWVDGQPLSRVLRETSLAQLEKKLTPGEVDRHLLFTFLAGASDRHAGNYLVAGKRLVTVDHEFSLPHDETPIETLGAVRHNCLLEHRTPLSGANKVEFDPAVVRDMAGRAGLAEQALRQRGLNTQADALAVRGRLLASLAEHSHPTYGDLNALAQKAST